MYFTFHGTIGTSKTRRSIRSSYYGKNIISIPKVDISGNMRIIAHIQTIDPTSQKYMACQIATFCYGDRIIDIWYGAAESIGTCIETAGSDRVTKTTVTGICCSQRTGDLQFHRALGQHCCRRTICGSTQSTINQQNIRCR
ncbi:MAG: hypothetical protein HGB01_12360 [Chlorobiaceae bacterium]|nr:hypothetical protein [Chlorobiaceae bacterium]